MIHLLCGPSGSGKSTHLLKEMADIVATGGQAYLLVPEQEAVARERAVMETLPPAAQLRFEVFNFSRLANHAFPPLDKNPMPGHLFELHPVNEVNTKGQ